MMAVKTPDTSIAAYEKRIELLREAVALYQPYLVRYVYAYTQHWQDAENIVQELWKYVIVYYKDENIKTLPMLRRKAYQLFIDQYRAKKRKPLTLLEELPEDKTASPASQSQIDTENELMVEFYSQFNNLDLTDMQKQVFWLYARCEMTYKDISQKLDIPVSTLGGWVVKARKTIADALSEGGNENG